MSEYLYRFRSLDRLLKCNELVNQEIFLASPSNLNDPIEGYLDVFWLGDQILWTNLFKHYLLCLELVNIQVLVGGDKVVLNDESISIFATIDKLPTDKWKEKVQKIYSDFFKNESIKKLIENLGSRKTKIKSDELVFYLKCLHAFALSVIASNNGGVGFSVDENNNPKKLEGLLSSLEKFSKLSDEDKTENEISFEIGESIGEQFALLRTYQNPSAFGEQSKRFLLLEFPRKFVERLEALIYPRWYAACFTESIENASLWGHYGDKHEGVCLKFKTTKISDQRIGIPLMCVQGVSVEKGRVEKKIMGSSVFEFKKVIYGERYPEADFFRSLGNLPKPVIDNYWYSDGNKNFSAYMSDVFKDYELWHENFWKTFYESKTKKLEEWKYESEWRLLMAPSAIDCLHEEDRLLKYNFSDLAGIVFGIKTPTDAKLRILEIIEKKCDQFKRYNFKFYQSIYSSVTGKINIVELPLLGFAPEQK